MKPRPVKNLQMTQPEWMLRIPVLAWLRPPREAELSIQGDGCQSEARPVVGDPELSRSERHPLVPDDDRLQGGVSDDLLDAFATFVARSIRVPGRDYRN